jgi:hypothetical protein
MRSEKLQAKLEKQARNKFDRWKKVHDKRFYLRNQEEEMELRVGLAYLKSCMQMYYYDKITIGDYEPPKVMYNDETCYFQLFWPAKEIEFIVEYLPKEDYRAFIDKLNEDYNTGMKSVNSTIRDSLIYNERLIQVNKTRHIPIRGPVGDKEREDALHEQRKRKYRSSDTINSGKGGKSN